MAGHRATGTSHTSHFRACLNAEWHQQKLIVGDFRCPDTHVQNFELVVGDFTGVQNVLKRITQQASFLCYALFSGSKL